MYEYFDPNPRTQGTAGDCVIRALSLVLAKSWSEVYLELAMLGFRMGDMMSANHVWGEYLKQNGFVRKSLPDTCPACYTVKDFCFDNPRGIYLLATGSHVVAVVNGDYFDAWDSGREVPVYYYTRK